MAKKQTEVKKDIKTSSLASSKDDVDLNLDTQQVSRNSQQLNFNNDQANGIKNRIINRRTTESTEDDRKFFESVEKSVRSGVEQGMTKPVTDIKTATGNFDRNKVESTEDPSSNKNESDKGTHDNDKLSSKLDKLVEIEEASKKSLHEKITSTVKAVDDFGGRKFSGKSSYALTLGAEAISPVLGQVVQLAITSGLGKSLWNLLAPNKNKDKDEKRHEEIKRVLNKLDGDLNGIKDSTARLLGVNKESDSKKADKEYRAEAKAKEDSDELKTSTKRLFGLQEKNSKILHTISRATSGLNTFLKGFSIVSVLQYLFNDKFRATVRGYLRNAIHGMFGAGEIATSIGAVTVALTSLTMIARPLISTFRFLFKTAGLAARGMLFGWKGIKSAWNVFSTSSSWLGKVIGSTSNSLARLGTKFGSLFSHTGKLGAKAGMLTKGLGGAFTAFEVVNKGMQAFDKFKKGDISGTVEETLKGVAYATLGPVGGLMAEAASGVGRWLGEKAFGVVQGIKDWFSWGDDKKKPSDDQKAKVELFKQLRSINDQNKLTYTPAEMDEAATQIMSGKATLDDFTKGNLHKQVIAIEVVTPKAEERSVGTEKQVIKKKTVAIETVKNTGNLKTTDNVNTAEMEAQKNAKVVVVEKKVDQPKPASQPIVNTIPSNSAMRPSLG